MSDPKSPRKASTNSDRPDSVKESRKEDTGAIFRSGENPRGTRTDDTTSSTGGNEGIHQDNSSLNPTTIKESKTNPKGSSIVLTDSWTRDIQLQSMPTDHTPAKIHVKLPKDTDVSQLLKNLSSCFQAMSCHAKYCNDPLSAFLLTFDFVEIQIVLWKAQVGDEIVLEVQHCQGDSTSFLMHARFIIDAAQDRFDSKAYHDNSATEGIDMKHLKAAELYLRRVHPQRDNDQQQYREDCIAALKNVHGLFKDNRMEARLLGMRSLCVLANPRTTGVATSVHVSRTILIGTSHDTADPFVGEVRGFLVSVLQNVGDVTSAEAKNNEDNPQLLDPVTLMLNLALSTLEHMWEVMLNLSELCEEPGIDHDSVDTIRSFLQYVQEVSERSLLGTLVERLGSADQEPHVACHCAKILMLLGVASDSVRQEIIDLQAVQAATSARTYGVARHAKLETECNRLLEVLSSGTQ